MLAAPQRSASASRSKTIVRRNSCCAIVEDDFRIYVFFATANPAAPSRNAYIYQVDASETCP